MSELERPVVVVGAGTMGRGIAYVGAVAGAEVRLVDVSAEQLDRAVRQIEDDVRVGIERGKVDAEAGGGALARISPSQDLAASCDGAGLVIEAVLERMDLKHDIFRTAERHAPRDAVLATNTSALSITEIVGCLDDPSRGVGMHFFNPVPKMRLCELIWGLQTSEETIRRAEAAAREMGKEAVRIADVPGFATSRVNALIGNEGFRLLLVGVATPEDIDTAVKLGLNHPMGPLEMADLVGLDVRLKVLEHLAETLGERFRPTTVHRNLVAAGRLGRKTGHGIYRYQDGRRVNEPSDLGR